MSHLYDDVTKYIDDLIAHYNEVLADGKISLSDAFNLTVNAVSGIAAIVKHVATEYATNDEMKQCVIDCVGRFYDEVIRPRDIAFIPELFENTIDDLIKNSMLEFLSVTIDKIISSVSQEKSDDGLPVAYNYAIASA